MKVYTNYHTWKRNIREGQRRLKNKEFDQAIVQFNYARNYAMAAAKALKKVKNKSVCLSHVGIAEAFLNLAKSMREVHK